MTNNENTVVIAKKFEEKAELLRALKFSNSGKELVKLLQELHDVILTQMIQVPADQVHRVAEYQGKYKIIHLLLERILEEEDAESG